jgi:tetratricopeptide (TPR) repeat protein
MSDSTEAAGGCLIALARPYLDRGDKDGLARELCERWTSACLVLLLHSENVNVVETAAICLGLIGEPSDARPLAALLHHSDLAVVAAAEDALWSIGFRANGVVAQGVLSRIARTISAGETENVVTMLTELINTYPRYAEAHHQRSQAHYLKNDYERALRDAVRAFELSPTHFGALAMQGNALAAMERYHEALERYRQVLHIHPRMPGIRNAIQHLRHSFITTPGTRLAYS